jgi:hypothetical protein
MPLVKKMTGRTPVAFSSASAYWRACSPPARASFAVFLASMTASGLPSSP